MRTHVYGKAAEIGRITLIILLALAIGVKAEPIDSTEVRKPQPVRKTLAEKLLSGPQFVIKLPIKTVEGLMKFVVYDVVDTDFAHRVYNALTRADRVWGFYPVGGYGSNSGLTGGLGFRSDGVFTSEERLRAKFSYSTNDYQRYRLTYHAPNFFQEARGVTARIEYRKSPRTRFYGLGGDSEESNEVAYSLEEIRVRLGGMWSLVEEASLEISGSYRECNLFDGEEPELEGDLDQIRDQLGLSGDDIRPSHYWTFELKLTRDTRDHKGRTTEGSVGQITYSYNHGTGLSSNLDFTTLQLDGRFFFEIYRERIIMLRLMARTTDAGTGDSDLPFYLRSTLGGLDMLRGFHSNRFTDNDMALITAEYRYPIWDVIDAFIFSDFGRVFEGLSDDFTFDNWQYSSGGGIRLFNDNGVKLIAQLAFSDEDFRVYFQLSEDF